MRADLWAMVIPEDVGKGQPDDFDRGWTRVAPGGDEIARVDDFDMPEHHARASYDARACQNRQPVLFHRHPGQGLGLDHTLYDYGPAPIKIVWLAIVESNHGLMLGYIKNPQPVLFHSHPGQTIFNVFVVFTTCEQF